MQNTDKKLLTVIEALSGGFELILQNPWVLILPVALDLFLWLGPPISAKPLFDHLLAFMTSGIVIQPNASPETLQSFELVKSALQTAGDTFNLLGVIATGLPTLFWIQPPMTDGARPTLLVIASSLSFLIWLVPLGLVGVLLTALYLEMIGRAVRQEAGVKTFAPRVIRGFGATTLLGMILLLALLVIVLPVSFGAAVLSLASQGLASFLMLAGMLLMLWATLYLAFALPSIFVSGSNAAQAIFNSISMFRFDFWSSMGLVILTYLIRWGFALVWQLLIDNPWGILFDVLANAFLGSGLVAAMMLFYADRMNWLDQLRARIRQEQAKLKG